MPKKSRKQVDKRGRTWVIIVYPDSAPENWRSILDDSHVAWVESPLHDKDKYEDGSAKKAHWHVVLMFSSMKSYSQVSEIAERINGAKKPHKVDSIRGQIRYLIHLDAPEKYQYERKDIVCHNGAVVDQYFQLSSASRLQALKEIVEFIGDSQIENFMDFLRYCLEAGEDEWFDIASNHNTMVISKAIDAVYQKNHPKEKNGQNSSQLVDKVSTAKEMAKKGVKNAVIADTLGVSERTVRRYLKK